MFVLTVSLHFILLIGLSHSNDFLFNENNPLTTISQITSRCNNQLAYNNLTKALDEFQSFFNAGLNLTSVEQATRLEKKLALEQILQDQCYEKRTYFKYLNELKNTLEACAGADEKSLIETGTSLIKNTIEYVCYKNGKRLALFFYRDGYECLANNTRAIEQCNADVFDNNTFINCKKYPELQKCVLQAIKDCDVLTPINMIHAFLKNIYLQSSCNQNKS